MKGEGRWGMGGRKGDALPVNDERWIDGRQMEGGMDTRMAPGVRIVMGFNREWRMATTSIEDRRDCKIE